MSDLKPFTIISGGANGVDLEAERFAREFGLPVQIFFPPCHPRKILAPVNASTVGRSHSNHKPSLQSPQQTKSPIASTNH